MSAAMVSNSLAATSKDLAHAAADGYEVSTILLKSSQSMFMDSAARTVGNVFFQGAAFHQDVRVGRSVYMYNSAWTLGLLRHLVRVCDRDGKVRVPVARSPREPRLTADELMSLAGDVLDLRVSGDVAELGAPDMVRSSAPTTLDHLVLTPEAAAFDYISHELIPELTLHEALSTRGEVHLCPWTRTHFEELATRKERPAMPGLEQFSAHWMSTVPLASTDRAFVSELQRAIGALSYIHDGVGYKAWALRKLVEELSGKKTGLRGADVGGAFGGLGLELLLESKPHFSEFHTYDLKPQNAGLFIKMASSYRDHLTGKVAKFSLTKGEDIRWSELGGFDLISEIKTMLYFERDRVAKFLEDAWEALHPGGLIVIHENIRNESYRKDYNKMFTVSEIDGFLQRFGPIVRFDPIRKSYVTAEEAGVRSIFRAVVKNG